MSLGIRLVLFFCILSLVSSYDWSLKSKSKSDYKSNKKIASTLYSRLNALEEHIEQFVVFTQEYGKSYRTESEVIKRFGIFLDNLRDIERLNARPNDTAVYGVNQFTDMTKEEFQTRLSSIPPSYSSLKTYNDYYSKDYKLPNTFDWRQQGKISSVKNQGQCGSCWAFATIAVLEAHAAIQGKGNEDYSEQQLVDCIESGCKGGQLPHAFGYLKDFGAMSASDYPYTAKQGDCQSHPVHMKFAEIVALPRDEFQMANSLVDGGPFAVAVLVSNSFQNYKSGVFNNDDCDRTKSDWHAMAVVGFGDDHWILKNSWGTGWGEDGYIKIARGRNWCHIAEWGMSGWV